MVYRQRAKAKAYGPLDGHLAPIFETLPDLYESMGVKWMSAGTILKHLYGTYKDDGFYDETRTAIEGLCEMQQPTAQSLGHVFRHYCRPDSKARLVRVVGGRRLVSRFDRHSGAQFWAVEEALKEGKD